MEADRQETELRRASAEGRPEAAVLTSRERMRRVLCGERADVVPAVPAYLCITLAPAFEQAYLRACARRSGGGGRLDHAADAEIRAAAHVEAYAALSEVPDWIELNLGPTHEQCRKIHLRHDRGRLRFEGDAGLDLRGVPHNHQLYRASAASGRPGDSGLIAGAADLEALFPAIDAEELLRSGACDVLKLISAEHGERRFLTVIMSSPYGFALSLLGEERLMLMQKDDPALLLRILERALQRAKEMASAAAAAGVHGVYLQEALSGADMISRKAFETFSLPYLAELLAHMRSEGLLSVLYYAGDALPRLGVLKGLGMSALACEEGKKGFAVPLEELVSQAGAAAVIFGNIDVVAPAGPCSSDERLRGEVLRQAAIGRAAKGFVTSSGSPLVPGCAAGGFVAFVRTSDGVRA